MSLAARFGTATALLVAVIGACTVSGTPSQDHFPLTGAHARAQCGSCHTAGLVGQDLPSTCSGCHEDARPPLPHEATAECDSCHTTEAWDDLSLVHEQWLSLAGKHTGVACETCHTGPDYTGLDAACEACHEGERPPAHFEGGCASCHSVAGWDRANIDHGRYLPLGGGHAVLGCTDCHVGDGFGGLDAACESCHERPAGHYAGACEGCHVVDGWDRADIDHSRFFPTPHRGVSECASCHLDAPDYTTFSCIDCHEHNKRDMDDKHLGEVSGYRYTSADCLRCHPDGLKHDN